MNPVPFLMTALALATSAMPAAAQAPDGKQLFQQRCQMCHGVDAAKPSVLAPNLAGVVGRKAASTGFAYSPALKASGLTWDRATLDTFLAAPMKLVPGTRMVVALSDAQQRAAVVAYLASLKK